MANEIELKLRIAPQDVDALGQHPAVLSHLIAAPITRQLTSIYYDTPDFKLKQAKTSLRVRHMQGMWFQAIKSAGVVKDGLHSRKEWEDKLEKGEPDFNKIMQTEMADFFSDLDLQATLKPIFTTEMSRTEWQLALANGKIEMSLDIGEIFTPNHTQRVPICEVELELKQGDTKQLLIFAQQLQQDIQLTAENTSKAGFGYALLKA